MGHRNNNRVYLGNLHPETKTTDIESLFKRFGKIVGINLVTNHHHQITHAFCEFDDPRDARDAVIERNGCKLLGRKLRVEFEKGNQNRGSVSNIRRTKYRVIVNGLPGTASWQDLKDHMRVAGPVTFSDVFRDGSGYVEYENYDGMRYALKHLNGSMFMSHQEETSYISVKRNGDGKHHRRTSSRERVRCSCSVRTSRRSASNSDAHDSPSASLRR